MLSLESIGWRCWTTFAEEEICIDDFSPNAIRSVLATDGRHMLWERAAVARPDYWEFTSTTLVGPIRRLPLELDWERWSQEHKAMLRCIVALAQRQNHCPLCDDI